MSQKLYQKTGGNTFRLNENVAEGGMPSSVIKHKQRLSVMSDEELANTIKQLWQSRQERGWKKETIEDLARNMAWRHGYGKLSDKYWSRIQPFIDNEPDSSSGEPFDADMSDS